MHDLTLSSKFSCMKSEKKKERQSLQVLDILLDYTEVATETQKLLPSQHAKTIYNYSVCANITIPPTAGSQIWNAKFKK